jgi:hypothetical protein
MNVAIDRIIVGQRRREDVGSVVYFVRAGSTGLIKIGVAMRPNRRLQVLQCGAPLALIPLGVIAGGRNLEGYLHVEFARARRIGEWFAPTTDLLAFIEREASPWPATDRAGGAADASGMPVYYNVGPRDDDGPPIYKPIPLFDLTDYTVAAKPYRHALEHAALVLQHLRSAAAVAGVQLDLPMWLPDLVPA